MARRDPNNRATYRWHPHVPGVSLLHADFTTQEFAPHSHDAFVVSVTEDGGSVIKSRGRVELATTRAMFVFNPDEPHAGWMGASERWLYRSLYLTQAGIDHVMRGLGAESPPYFLDNLYRDPDLIDEFLAANRALDDDRDGFRAQELLIGAFGRLFARHGAGGSRIAPAPRDALLLRRATDLLRARHAETPTLADLEAATGLTTFQVIGLFKRTVGLPPHAWLTQVRLRAACRLLRRGAPIAEAATDSGFYDQSALTKHFRRNYGITPQQFRTAALAA